MPTTFGSLRRLVRTPSLAEVSGAGRGVQVTSTDVTRRLEAIRAYAGFAPRAPRSRRRVRARFMAPHSVP